MSELESNFNLLSAHSRCDASALGHGSLSAADCRALSVRCYSAAGAIKSQPHKALLTAMGRTWVQLANQIDRLKLLQEAFPQSRDAME